MRKESSNQFTEGVISDLNPINTPNTVLTDALNATIITYDGNEHSLQNDRGNYPLKNCKLKPNYIPVGIKEYNGILYIVSYNPLDQHVEIGSYPSPMQATPENDPGDNERTINSIIKTGIIDNGLTEKNYSDLSELEKQIVFGGDKYKLNPGDQYEITNEPELYAYEALEYFVLDEASILHDITENIKNRNKDSYNYVSWLVPGWIVAKIRLAQIDGSEFNIRSFNVVKSEDESTSNASYNFNFKANVDDYIINNRLDELYDEFIFKVKITGTSGYNESREIPVKSISTWYLDKNIIWSSYKGTLEDRNSNEIITVSVTPILRQKDENGNTLYDIVYDDLTRTQEFDLSKSNDEIFKIDSEYYKFYLTDDKSVQTIETKIQGPSVTSAEVDLYYTIKDLVGNKVKEGKFENYEGVGSNLLTISFEDNDDFEKENIYNITFDFKSTDDEVDIMNPTETKLLITTELLGPEEDIAGNEYEQKALQKAVDDYFENFKVDWSNAVTQSSDARISSEGVLEELINNKYKFNTFIKADEFDKFVKDNYDNTVAVEIDAKFNPKNVNIHNLSGELWDTIYTQSYAYTDSSGDNLGLPENSTITGRTEIAIPFNFGSIDDNDGFLYTPEWETTLYDHMCDNESNEIYLLEGGLSITKDDFRFNVGGDLANFYFMSEYEGYWSYDTVGGIVNGDFDGILNKPFVDFRDQTKGQVQMNNFPCYLLTLTVVNNIYNNFESWIKKWTWTPLQNGYVSKLLVFSGGFAINVKNKTEAISFLKKCHIITSDKDICKYKSIYIDIEDNEVPENVSIKYNLTSTFKFSNDWKLKKCFNNITHGDVTLKCDVESSANVRQLWNDKKNLLNAIRAEDNRMDWLNSVIGRKLNVNPDELKWGAYPSDNDVINKWGNSVFARLTKAVQNQYTPSYKDFSNNSSDYNFGLVSGGHDQNDAYNTITYNFGYICTSNEN